MSSITPKNWQEFQHYKDRSPGWIKLHRHLLDDFEFCCLPVASRALAPMLWLLASEYEGAKIPLNMPKLAFRLRMTVDELASAVKPLIDSGFFLAEQDASEVLAECLPRVREEREREIEEEREKSSPPAPRSAAPKQAPNPLNRKTWLAYSSAYFDRYQTEPVQNQKANSLIVTLVRSLGEEAPHVAAFYLTHKGQWYVQKLHSLEALVKDAEALRTQWATNRTVTQHQARSADRHGETGAKIDDAFAKLEAF